MLEAKRRELAEKYPDGLPPEGTDDPCPKCSGAGHLVLPHDPTQVPEVPIVPCPACKDGRVARERRQQTVIRRSGLEGRERVTFSETPPLAGQETQWERAMTYSMRPVGWLVLNGGFYVGKTLLATCVANEWLELGKAVLFRNVPELLDELRATYQEGGERSFNVVFSEVIHIPCLILDDYGKEKESDWSTEKLFQLTDCRLERALPTVLTTNFSMPELQRRNPRLFRRLADTKRCDVIQFSNDPIER